jgi:hypothetical protein
MWIWSRTSNWISERLFDEPLMWGEGLGERKMVEVKGAK